MATLVRPARPDESGPLGDLALRSKAHWGYDAAFLEACRVEPGVGVDDIERDRVTVAHDDPTGAVLGFYELEGSVGGEADGKGAEVAELSMLLVEPSAIGGSPSRSIPGRTLPRNVFGVITP